jgi:hypothetical protein
VASLLLLIAGLGRHPAKGVFKMMKLEHSDELETFYDLTVSLQHDLAIGRVPYEWFADSRSRMDIVIGWANEFNTIHAETDWGVDLEYMDEVDSWYAAKILAEYGEFLPGVCRG